VDILSHVWLSSHRLFFFKVLADNSNEIRPILDAFELAAIPDKKSCCACILVVMATLTQLLRMTLALNIDPHKYGKHKANIT
jgi:hypothetical protein